MQNGAYNTNTTALSITGTPNKWNPNNSSNSNNGLPADAYIKNIKFVSNNKFTTKIGNVNIQVNIIAFGTNLISGTISPPATNTIGYAANKIWKKDY